MKKIYIKCPNCDRRGYYPQPHNFDLTQQLVIPPYYPPLLTTHQFMYSGNVCHVCNGSGRKFVGWIDD